MFLPQCVSRKATVLNRPARRVHRTKLVLLEPCSAQHQQIHSELGKHGNSKQKRADLKIVGLSLMVAPNHNIPLFPEVYPRNKPDTRQFNDVIDKLKDRFRKLGRGECEVTLVFDKGNNNEDNIIELIEAMPCSFHFVGGLRLNQCPELLEIPKSEYRQLDGPFNEATAYGLAKEVYRREFAVVVTYNKALSALKEWLLLRREGAITKGKKPIVASVEKT